MPMQRDDCFHRARTSMNKSAAQAGASCAYAAIERARARRMGRLGRISRARQDAAGASAQVSRRWTWKARSATVLSDWPSTPAFDAFEASDGHGAVGAGRIGPSHVCQRSSCNQAPGARSNSRLPGNSPPSSSGAWRIGERLGRASARRLARYLPSTKRGTGAWSLASEEHAATTVSARQVARSSVVRCRLRDALGCIVAGTLSSCCRARSPSDLVNHARSSGRCLEGYLLAAWTVDQLRKTAQRLADRSA